jgi:zinc protease
MRRLLLLLCIVLHITCSSPQPSAKIEFEKYTLDNGLEVVLHEDHSDPIVAVATVVHVGSNREKPGRTGFAHFFEHMSFNDSENVPRGANRKLIPELGGIRNGGTSTDGTIYFEVVPKDAFEKVLWIDSDRLGFMINTVTEAAVEREKQVVKNEKRQRVDNAPYGHTEHVIKANLYPPDHPHHWTVIGSLPDLQAATLEDVREFYDRYYGASNATLAISGDIDIEATKVLVERWFGEIRRGPDVEPLPPMPVKLAQAISLFHEDNFAKLPELTMALPTVESYHADSHALSMLTELLAGSKKSSLYKVIVEEKKLAPRVSVYNYPMEVAGELRIEIRANPGVDLDEVKAAIEEGFVRFERDGFTDNQLARVKAEAETRLYFGVSSVLMKTFQLAYLNEYTGDPGYLEKDAERMRAVTRADVMRVWQQYVKDKPYVVTSFVPKGQPELALEGAVRAEVFEEPITEGGAEEQVSQGEEAVYEKTPTRHDRSEPDLGPPPLLSLPEIWTDQLDNGIEVLGIVSQEVPLVGFQMTLRGGHWLDPLDRAGTAHLLAELMMQGTANRTPEELEEAIGLLGAAVFTNSSDEQIEITGYVLARNFEPVIELLEEILLEPRWDEDEFDRLKRELMTTLKGDEGSPDAIASMVFGRLLYGDQHPLGTPVTGTLATADQVTIDDLKQYYATNLSPQLAAFHVVGPLDQQRVRKALAGLGSRWQQKAVEIPEYSLPEIDRGEKVYFVDQPGAKQSVIHAGRLVLAGNDPDWVNLSYANERLGGGSSGRLFQLLRIEKGYTYGAYSGIARSLEVAPFRVRTSVRSNVTLESLQLIRQELEGYAKVFDEEEMETTKYQIIRRNTQSFEPLNAKLGMLTAVSTYDLPLDYVLADQEELMAMDLAEFHRVIGRYIDESEMFYLVVGDAATQLGRIADLGYGQPEVLDIYGNQVGR